MRNQCFKSALEHVTFGSKIGSQNGTLLEPEKGALLEPGGLFRSRAGHVGTSNEALLPKRGFP